MKKRFTAEVLTGHKDHAVEVPFDPTETWGLPLRPIWRGRRGHIVSGTLNGFHFDKIFIVPRSKKFFLIVDKNMAREARVSVGDAVRISVEPKEELDTETR
jgi:hypothetical protein